MQVGLAACEGTVRLPAGPELQYNLPTYRGHGGRKAGWFVDAADATIGGLSSDTQMQRRTRHLTCQWPIVLTCTRDVGLRGFLPFTPAEAALSA